MNFESKLNLKNEELNQLLDKLNVKVPLKNISLRGKSKHELNVILDKTLQILSYDYFFKFRKFKFLILILRQIHLPFLKEV